MTTKTARSLFLDALELPPERWSEYLDDVCEGDLALHQKIVRLLAAHQQIDGFMNQPAAEGAVTEDHSRETIGAQIGPYELKEQIGEGGMGIVYVAEQKQPIRRFVAIKVIKPGMDSKQVVARFEAERQALAIMDHPNIARVIDGGTTEQGRPYFVMELVRGVPITEFCDAERLTIRERLKLFCQVCEAVQHAHQKGIIHRDLKPSNVLVTQTDAGPVPKVIDFGIAKAVNQPLTEKTIYSQVAQMIGTPLYMSPEQAQLTGLDIDTRSDVYSLGVLLYELLTGTTPFAPEILRDQGLDEFRRLVREEEPTHPSHRISTLNAEAGSTISAKRGVDHRRLRQLMRGELDWIALRCLDKERSRRYQSASALADDVQRYLDDKAIEASPPSTWYRFRKFAKRNRAPLAAATIAITALLVATGVSLWQVRVANAAHVLAGERLQAVSSEKENAKRSAADALAVLDFFQKRVLSAARPEGLDGGLGINATIRDAIDAAEPEIATEFADRPLVEASLRHTIGSTLIHLGDSQRAVEQLERSREIYEQQLGAEADETIEQAVILSAALYEVGRADDSRALLEASLLKKRKKLGPDHSESLGLEGTLAAMQVMRGDVEEATQALIKLRERCERVLQADDETTLQTLSDLATAYLAAGNHEAAIPLMESQFAKAKEKFGETDASTLVCAGELAAAYKSTGRTAEAQAMFETLLATREKIYGPKNPRTLQIMTNLGSTYVDAGRFDMAVPLLEKALAGSRERQGENHPDNCIFQANLGRAYCGIGDIELGMLLLEGAHEGMKKHFGGKHRSTLTALSFLIQYSIQQGQLDNAQKFARERVAQGDIENIELFLTLNRITQQFEAADRLGDLEPLWRETFEMAQQELGWEAGNTQTYMETLIRCYAARKQPEKIEALWRELISWWAARAPNSGNHSREIYNLAYHLLDHSRVDEAKALAEQAWEMVKTTEPDNWRTFEVESLLGACLLAKRDYDGARPHLQAGFRGMRDSKDRFNKTRLIEPLDRIAQLCEETDQWEDAVRNRYYANEMRRQFRMPLDEPKTKR